MNYILEKLIKGEFYKLAVIYVMKNTVNDIVYIGQTNDTLKSRLSHHKGQVGYDSSSIHKAMGTLGKDKFYIEKLEDVSDDLANECEVKWMNYFLNAGYTLYNDKLTAGKCGGDTLSNHKNIKEIGDKIRSKCTGGNNSNASAIIAIDLKTGETKEYSCMKDCQVELGIDRHDIISRRCRGIILKPYKNRYNFKYK